MGVIVPETLAVTGSVANRGSKWIDAVFERKSRSFGSLGDGESCQDTLTTLRMVPSPR